MRLRRGISAVSYTHLDVYKRQLERSRAHKVRISKAYIEITNRCNLNCTTCYNRSGLNTVTREIGVTELERMITTFTAYGAKRILISGGEPTLHSEFEKIAALPSRYPQLSFGVTTNGTTAAARSVLAPAIKSQKNMTLQISLDGSSEETNALTRGRGNFEKAVEFARSVSDAPAEKRLKMVVSRGNLAAVSYTHLDVYKRQVRYLDLAERGIRKRDLLVFADYPIAFRPVFRTVSARCAVSAR